MPGTDVVADLWRAAHGEIGLAAVVARHRFHGPAEGELSGRVWREDSRPLERLVAEYTERPDPRARDAERREDRLRLERELVTAVPAVRRPVVRLLLGRAERSIPLRGVSETAFLQAFDVVRAAARRAGTLPADPGVLATPEDVVFLTDAELLGVPSLLDGPAAGAVARELGVPCVVDTRDGSRLLRAGDLVRVDGGRGTVEVLKPAGEGAEEPAGEG